MKWLAVRVRFNFTNHELATDLISCIFYDLGLKGLVIEDQETTIKGDGVSTIPRTQENNAVIGYLPVDEKLTEQCETLNHKLNHLQREMGIQSWTSFKEIKEEDWAESWKPYFQTHKIGNRVVIKPTWREYDPDPEEIVIEIDPGMAFGTGLHPTTRMCITLIEKYLARGHSFLDIGTGSGILLILAAKLGAKKIVGIDNDVIAIDIAKKNLLLNHIHTDSDAVRTGDLLETIADTYDLVTANITSDIILSLVSEVSRVLNPKGIFICSGMSIKNQKAIIEKMKTSGFEIIEVLKDEDWGSIAGRLKV